VPHTRPLPVEDLTDVEMETLTLIRQGYSNTEISDHLVVSIETVKSRVKRILHKLGARDRTNAVEIAWQIGLCQRDAARRRVRRIIASGVITPKQRRDAATRREHILHTAYPDTPQRVSA
jgi:DNA-binding CsgD family transcriptional regulator